MILRGILAVLACAAIATTACGDSGGASPPAGDASPTAVASVGPAQCAPARAHDVGLSRASIQSGGRTREYLLHVPRGYDGAAAMPLLLLFHGYALDAESMYGYSQVAAGADRLGYVVVVPKGTGPEPHWNVQGDANDADDPAFVRDLIAELDRTLCLDAQRTFAAGFSNGGSMAQLAACDMPDRIAAVATVATPYVNCRVALPLLAFHGTSDPLVPFEGGGLGAPGAPPGPPVRRSLSEWARAAGCDALPTISRPSSEVELSTFPRCPGDIEVLLYAIIQGGHTWPGSFDVPLAGYTTHQVDATSLMLEFFARHPLR